MEIQSALPPLPETPVPRPIPRVLPYVALLVPVVLLVWVFGPYPSIWRKASGEIFILSISWWTLAKLAAVFYGIYLFPGLALIGWKTKTYRLSRILTARNVLLAFALGCSAHVLGAFLQKYLHLPYRVPVVIFCLLAGYLLSAALLAVLPARKILPEDPPAKENPWEAVIADLLLGIALFLGLEMTLRGRGSSLSLTGDGYPHLINFLGTLEDGPFPDGLPFYSTMILNVHPMGFHAMLADLKTVTPGLLHIDLLRYFSVLMVPVFVACMMGFFSWLGRSRMAGAFLTLAALFVSGGGMSLSIPIVFFPWYWSIAWCLTAAVFFLLLKDELESSALAFVAGWVMGVGVLMHPFFAFRMAAIMVCFLPLEILRRLLAKQKITSLLPQGALFALGAALPVAAWIIPIILRYGWEETYTYNYIVENFSAIAPEGVNYIRGYQEARYVLLDLWRWSLGNAGLIPILLAPLGLAATFREIKHPVTALLWAWLIAMAVAAVSGHLFNANRYFEFFFFGLCAAAAFGLGRVLNGVPFPWRLYAVAVLLCFSFLSIRREFYPKYQRALSLYGRTSLTPKDVAQAEKRSESYFRSKKAGTLDRDYGSYTGYLWSRQKKVWDIYVQNQLRRQEK